MDVEKQAGAPSLYECDGGEISALGRIPFQKAEQLQTPRQAIPACSRNDFRGSTYGFAGVVRGIQKPLASGLVVGLGDEAADHPITRLRPRNQPAITLTDERQRPDLGQRNAKMDSSGRLRGTIERERHGCLLAIKVVDVEVMAVNDGAQ